MKNQAAVVIETGQTLSRIGRGARRWVFPAGERVQAGSEASPNPSPERSA
jgi:hypothetical protein